LQEKLRDKVGVANRRGNVTEIRVKEVGGQDPRKEAGGGAIGEVGTMGSSKG